MQILELRKLKEEDYKYKIDEDKPNIIEYVKPLLHIVFTIEVDSDELYWLTEDPKMGLRRKFNIRFEEALGAYIRSILLGERNGT